MVERRAAKAPSPVMKRLPKRSATALATPDVPVAAPSPLVSAATLWPAPANATSVEPRRTTVPTPAELVAAIAAIDRAKPATDPRRSFAPRARSLPASAARSGTSGSEPGAA
jgi:hypothetical protein